MKIIDIVIIAVIVIAVCAALFFIFRKRKKGCSCCDGCGQACPKASVSGKQPDDKR